MRLQINSPQSFVEFIEEEFTLNNKLVIGIDGRASSGKTTFGNALTHIFHVIHMDDFFLTKELRTENRLKECGGNVHYERFTEEVADKIREGNKLDNPENVPFTYRVFDCTTFKYTGSVTVPRTKPILIEGAYTLREEFRDIYDFKMFFNISKEEQKKRVIKRNGIDEYQDYKERWIPKEEAYINGFDIMKVCDLVVN